jgi:hypothetical protein
MTIAAHPDQARACLRESRELSAALGYQSTVEFAWAGAIASLVGDQAATLEFAAGRSRQHRCRAALPRPPAQPPATNDLAGPG